MGSIGSTLFRIKGFTLVELIVSVSIMVMVLTITLMQRPEATLKLSLNDNASSLEFMLREVQLQGSAVNSVNNTYGGAGVFLDFATNTQALRFKDRVDETIPSTLGVGDKIYSYVDDFEEQYFVFDRGNKIVSLCVSASTSSFMCNSDNIPPISSLTISYSRPKTNASLYVNNATSTAYEAACIQMQTIKGNIYGHIRSIVIYKSGVIFRSLQPCTSL